MDRLPRGRHGLSPEFVARNQRDRLIAALILTLAEVGYQKTTVSMIGRRAAVSKSDFYKHFDSKDECFVAAYETRSSGIRAAVVDACAAAAGEEWAAPRPGRRRRPAGPARRRAAARRDRPRRGPARRPRHLRPLPGRGRGLRAAAPRRRARPARRSPRCRRRPTKRWSAAIASLLSRRTIAGETAEPDGARPRRARVRAHPPPRHRGGAANNLRWMSEAQSAVGASPRAGARARARASSRRRRWPRRSRASGSAPASTGSARRRSSPPASTCASATKPGRCAAPSSPTSTRRSRKRSRTSPSRRSTCATAPCSSATVPTWCR